jgi:hypothetical protein
MEELITISEANIGPFKLGENYKDAGNQLLESKTNFDFSTRRESEYITIKGLSFHDVKIKELTATCQAKIKLIIMEFHEEEIADNFYLLIDRLIEQIGDPTEKDVFGKKKNFLTELFKKSDKQIIRDSWQKIQGKPSQLRWYFGQSKLIINLNLLEYETAPFKKFAFSVRLSSNDYPKRTN